MDTPKRQNYHMGRGVRCDVQVSVVMGEGCEETLTQCLVVLPCILKYDLGCGRYRDRGIGLYVQGCCPLWPP